MPFTRRAIVELVWQDSSGSVAATTTHILHSSTYAQADAAASALASVLASMTDCVLVRQRITFRIVTDPITSPVFGGTVVRRGVFFFSAGELVPMALIEIPSLKESVLVTDGPTAGYAIDLSNADIATFVDTIIDNDVSNPFADNIVSIEAAYLQSRV